MRIDTVVLAKLMILGLLVAPVGAVTHDVNSLLDDADLVPGDGNCISETIGKCTLRAAIQESSAVVGDDVINLPAGNFVLTIPGINENASVTGDLDVQGNISIYGEGADLTIIDANGIDRVFDLHSGVLELVGLTVTGGRATSAGSFLGGGIQAGGSLLSIGGCHLTDNVANQGGAIFSSTATAVQIMDSLLEGNATELSGFTNPSGAAIRSEGALTLESSTITGNTGYMTGYYAVDVQCYTGTVSVVNSTIAGNQASGLTTYSCAVAVLHSTIYGNSGGGLVLGSFTGSELRTVTNSVIAGQGVQDCGGVLGSVTFDHCLDSDGSCGLGAGSLPMTDPLLLPLRYWGGLTPTMYPTPVTSPVIDVANGTACYITDQRGEVRGGDGNGDGTPGCDIGSVEAGDLIFLDDFEDGTTGAW